jgi:hypothetical protein
MSMQFHSCIIFGMEVNHWNMFYVYREHKLSTIRQVKRCKVARVAVKEMRPFSLTVLKLRLRKKYVFSYLAIWDYTSQPVLLLEFTLLIYSHLRRVRISRLLSLFFLLESFYIHTYAALHLPERCSRYQCSSRSNVPAYLRLLLLRTTASCVLARILQSRPTV